jgi:hypothetical protein
VTADSLTADLEAAPAVEALSTETVNKTKRWLVTLVPAAADAAGVDALKLSTAEACLFLAGLKAGGAARPAPVRRAGGPRGKNPYRDAIERDGRVEATIPDPGDPASVKRTRDAVFAAAYGLGLKGRFTVARDGDRLVGETTGGAAA